jgi:hypothetical protein
MAMHDDIELIINNAKIKQVSCLKFLGLEIDDNFARSQQIRKICSKISSGIYMIRNINNSMPYWAKHMIYMSFVLIYLTYGLLMWGPMALPSDLSSLVKLQKKAVRLFENTSYNAHTLPLFGKHKFMKILDMIFLELTKFMYRFIDKSLPTPLLNLFQSNYNYHSYNTRNSNAAIIPHHK